MRVLPIIALLLTSIPARAQWTIEDSHTTADLRGIHSIGNGIAWASGTNGTVLRTEDGGYLWQTCAIPPGAEKLDFRGIQAFDANTAIVMSSGPGDQSRLYKTTDACATWKLVFTNPDKDGFFDALKIAPDKSLNVLGDPVNGKFAMFLSQDAGLTWFVAAEPGRDAPAGAGAGAFAASNSSLGYAGEFAFFATGASADTAARVYRTHPHCAPVPGGKGIDCAIEWTPSDVPLDIRGASSGIFSLALHDNGYDKNGLPAITVVAVGGSYEKPEVAGSNAAVSKDGAQHWAAAQTPPHGYRSAVAYEEKYKTWITVGPNGTDISTDDGRNWRALKPASTDALDADKNWNALSLPYVVGPKGRIGKLNAVLAH